MRRKERMMSLKDAEEFLMKAPVGRLGTSWKDEPYVVPMNFAYHKGKILLHCAKKGRKLDYIAENPRVCFEVDELLGIRKGEEPCSFGAYYRSVIAFGEAQIIETMKEKVEALKKIMEKYAGVEESTFEGEKLERVRVVEISVKSVTGKQRFP